MMMKIASGKAKILVYGASALIGLAAVTGSLWLARNEMLSSAANLSVSDGAVTGEAESAGITEAVTDAATVETAAPEVTALPETEPPMTAPPATEAPETEATTTTVPAALPPVTEPPATESEAAESPTTDAPKTEAPMTDVPETEPPMTDAPETEPPMTAAPVTSPPETDASDRAAAEYAYVLNVNSMKFHHPTCSSVKQMKEENAAASNESRDALIDMGYSPCGRCKP